jgi:nitrous oxidase accessory protein NosD
MSGQLALALATVLIVAAVARTSAVVAQPLLAEDGDVLGVLVVVTDQPLVVVDRPLTAAAPDFTV